MSAWIVDRVHIDLLVEAATRPNLGICYQENGQWRAGPTREERDAIGQMLLMENVASVAYRYDEEPGAGELPGPCERYYLDPYTYTARHCLLSNGEILNLIACYEYQACEHPGWEESGAHSLCKSLFRHYAMTFSEGPWGWDESCLADKPKSISLLDMMEGKA
jgi:hypothetical protein